MNYYVSLNQRERQNASIPTHSLHLKERDYFVFAETM